MHTHKIVDGVKVSLTSEEIAIIEAEEIVFEQEQTRLKTERIAEQQAQATVKASAIAKLTALGLSAEEISAIGA
jgi:hypothetical protein